MIFGIGTDVLELSRIKNPELLAKKILTKTELQIFNFAKNKQNFVAKRFSVKEAVAKALGVGIGKSVSFKDIEILLAKAGSKDLFSTWRFKLFSFLTAAFTKLLLLDMATFKLLLITL